jgi:hypothetical protein
MPDGPPPSQRRPTAHPANNPQEVFIVLPRVFQRTPAAALARAFALAAALGAAAAPTPAAAAVFRIEALVRTNESSTNWFELAGYARSFTGTITVRDDAVRPDGIAVFGSPAITGFEMNVIGPLRNFELRLGDDLFPADKGLRFDAAGLPAFFDMPGWHVCTSCATITDTGAGIDPAAYAAPFFEFMLSPATRDAQSEDWAFAADGLLYKRADLPAGLAVLHEIAGDWRFDSGYALDGNANAMKGLYTITAVPPGNGGGSSGVPLPGTVWLALAALGLMRGVPRIGRR